MTKNYTNFRKRRLGSGVTAGLFEFGTEDGLRGSGGVSWRGGLVFLVVFASHVRFLERAFGVADSVVRHPLIREKIGAFQLALRGYYPGEYVGVKFVAYTVPEEFLAGIDETIDITDTNPTTQVPEFLLVEVPGGV